MVRQLLSSQRPTRNPPGTCQEFSLKKTKSAVLFTSYRVNLGLEIPLNVFFCRNQLNNSGNLPKQAPSRFPLGLAGPVLTGQTLPQYLHIFDDFLKTSSLMKHSGVFLLILDFVLWVRASFQRERKKDTHTYLT